MDIEIWSDVVCPWCYLGKRQFEQALESFEHGDDVWVIYRSYELDPTAPLGVSTLTVESLADKYGMTSEQADDAQRQMEERAAQVGLEFHLDGLRSGNTRDAHRLLHLAKKYAVQPALMERLHQAYFTEQASIFDPQSLTALAGDVGLDGAEVAAVLEGDRYADQVDRDEAMASSIGITGVPFFVLDRRFAISGAQSTDVVLQSLRRAWSELAGSDR